MKPFMLLSLLFAFAACSKNENTQNSNCVLNRSNFIGVYKLASVTQISPTGVETNALGGACYKSCELDDTYEFRSDSAIFKDNTLACATTDNYGASTWDLFGDTLQITEDWNPITRDNTPHIRAKILNFNCNSFTVFLGLELCPVMGTRYKATYKRN
jgi:hypothetical protein